MHRMLPRQGDLVGDCARLNLLHAYDNFIDRGELQRCQSDVPPVIVRGRRRRWAGRAGYEYEIRLGFDGLGRVAVPGVLDLR